MFSPSCREVQVSNDPKLRKKVRDIVGLYLNPPDRALVLCVDEKSQIQALDRTAPILPLRPGLPERQTHDYKRHGTTTLFAAFNILNGKVIGSCLPRHRGKEFLKFLNQVEKKYHAIWTSTLCWTTTRPTKVLKSNVGSNQETLPVPLSLTPTSSSWLNQVERFFGLITERMIRRGTFHSVEELERAIYDWLLHWNDNPKSLRGKLRPTLFLDRSGSVKNYAGHHVSVIKTWC